MTPSRMIQGDEYSWTGGDHLDMMNNHASSSNDVPASERHQRGSMRQDTRTDPPQASSQSGRNASSRDPAMFHQYNSYQQNLPPNAFGAYGATYPTSPIAWQHDLNTLGEDDFQDSQSEAFDYHRVPSLSTSYAEQNDSSFLSRRPQEEGGGPQTLLHPWNQDQYPRPAVARPAMATSQPIQQGSQYGTSGWYCDPTQSAAPRQFAATSNIPSPYAAQAPDGYNYSRPNSNGPTVQRLQAEAIRREKRHPAAPAVEDDVKDGEDLSEEEMDRVNGQRKGSTTAKGTTISKKASKAKENAHRGLTCVNVNGELEWLATADSEGVLAVRHDDIRPQLIAIAETERVALGVENEHPDDPGPGKYNRTSFYHEQAPWGPDREDRPEILFDWEEDRDENPRPKCPGYMYWEEGGKRYIVLDPHDNPVKDWNIPLTIASNVPGYKLEAMRRENMSLGHKDFWARMPSQINVGTEDQPIWEELGNPNSVVNMPMERFRFHAGLCSWTERKKTLIIKAGLKKLYGNKLQNNSIRSFGRDLTKKETSEIKKGDSAIFLIEDDVVPDTRKTQRKRKSKGAARPLQTRGNAKGAKGQSRKRKHSDEDEGDASSEEETLPQVRPYKRARYGRKDDSIAAEVDDLVMFEQSASIIDQDDASRRYSLRSTPRDAKASERIEPSEDSSNENSTDEDYAGIPARRHPTGKVRSIAKARWHIKRLEESSAEEESDYVATLNETTEEPQSDSDRVELAARGSSRGSSVSMDDEETEAERFPFRRISGAADVGGKSKGPSWLSSTTEKDQSNEEQDYRRTVVPVSIDGKIHHATYEGLISNGGSVSNRPRPHPFDVTMSMPIIEERNLEGEDSSLQVHRKRVRDFLGDEEAEAHAPPLKRLCTEQPVLPLSGSATDRAIRDLPQVVSPPINPPKLSRKQELDAEWAQVFEQTFLAFGLKSVNYSEVPPWNEDEVHSLIDALLPTREVYSAWTGTEAPRTDVHQSYRAQFDTIFVAFQDWWIEHHPNEPLPILAGVMHWGRSVDDWEPPSKDSIYYEAFRNGYQAPRAADGGVSVWPGPILEDTFRMRH